MTVVRRLVVSGYWLFRWRSFLPILIVVSGVVSMLPIPTPSHDGPIPDSVEVAALVISFLGLLVRILTIGYTPAGTSGRNTTSQIAEVLNTTGAYSLMRHPLYFGNFLIGFGLAGFTLTWWFPVFYILVFWLYYERIMIAEEDFLRGRFGHQFEDWAMRTPPFLPAFRQFIKPSLSFSTRNVFRREYNSLLQIAVVSFILEFFGDWFDTKTAGFSAPWCTFLFCSVVVWFVLRFLKRNTQTLVVAGR